MIIHMTRRPLTGLAVSLGLLVLGPSFARAQLRDSLALEHRAAEIGAFIGGASLSLDTVFNATVLAQVPPQRMRAIAAQLATLGHVTRTTFAEPVAPAAAARFDMETDQGYVIPLTVGVDETAPNLVSGLLFGPPTKRAGSLDDVLKSFAELPGHASFFAARIDNDQLVPLAALDTGHALAIGSAFKLFVLSELVREIDAGRRHWTDVVPLDSASRSLPSGVLQTWPLGTPVTVQTLATLMISQSDNTAADHLLHLLGRENVERVQSVVGNTHAARNTPFLSTRDMFALKSSANTALLSRYLASTPAGRRSLLADPALVSPLEHPPTFANGPLAIDSVEWFASTADLARTLLWLRDHSATGAAAAARGVLSVNRGIDWPKATWPFVGFKGGSEPGVLNLSFVAQRTDGVWFTFIATWNDPARAVDENKFIALVTGARDLIARR